MNNNKFNNGKIYKIVDNDNAILYIGSTTQSLNVRLSEHKSKSKEQPNRPIYEHINNIGWYNIRIELIENINCDDIKQLTTRERHFIDELKPKLNKQLPGQPKHECDKKYYEANKTKILDHKKIKHVCVCGGRYSNTNKAQHHKSKKHLKYVDQQQNNNNNNEKLDDN